MSSTSKITLVLSCIVSTGIIAHVCIRQQSDRQKLRETVWKEVEKQQRKTENLYMLQQQIDLEKKLKKERDLRQANA